MKNRKSIITLAAITIGLAMGLGFAQAGDQTVAPEQAITIDGKKPVSFKHDTHLDLGIACGECHHNDKHEARTAEEIGAMTDTTVIKCASCHKEGFANPELQNAKDIFHLTCKGCHKEGLNGKKGPTKCSDCHGKTKKAVEGC